MVNIGFGWPSILGIALVLAGAGLYAMRSMRPALARDQDIFFAAIALLCGGILFFQGWRLDPILQFAQTLSVASAIWFAYEAVRLRGIATEQAKRTTPVVDEERPVSRVYRAELDDYPPIDERERFPVNRRIRGTRDARRDEEYDYETRRSSTRRSVERPSLSDRPLSDRPLSDRPLSDRSGDRPRRPRSSRSSTADSSDQYDRSNSWNDDMGNVSSSRPARPEADPDQSSSRYRRSSASRRSSNSTDYVDYQPVDYSDDWS